MVAPAKTSGHILARIWFSVLATVSVTVGFAPLLLFLARPFWLCLIAIVALLISLGYSANLEPKNERPLTATESVAVIIGSLSEGSIIAFMLFAFYGALWLIAFVIGWVLSRWFGGAPSWIGDIVAGIVAMAGSVLLLGVVAVTAKKLKRWVFPDVGIGNAALLPYVKPGETSPRAIIATLVLALFVGLSVFLSSYFYIALQLCLAVISGAVSGKLEMRGPSAHNKTVRAAVRAMLQACGYEVVDRVQTRRLELDRVIAVFDVVAHRNGYALAVQLKTDEEETAPVSINEAAYLRSAARAMYGAFGELDVPIHSVLPMMLLSGRSCDSSLSEFAQQQSIRVAELPDRKTLEEIRDNKLPEEKIRELSLTYLGLRGQQTATQVKAS